MQRNQSKSHKALTKFKFGKMKSFSKIFALALLTLTSACKVSNHPEVIDDTMLRDSFGISAPPIPVSQSGVMPTTAPPAAPTPTIPVSKPAPTPQAAPAAVAQPSPMPTIPASKPTPTPQAAPAQVTPPQAHATFMPPQKTYYQEPQGYGTYNSSDYHSYNPNYPPTYYAPNYNPYSNEDSYNPNRQTPRPQRPNQQ